MVNSCSAGRKCHLPHLQTGLSKKSLIFPVLYCDSEDNQMLFLSMFFWSPLPVWSSESAGVFFFLTVHFWSTVGFYCINMQFAITVDWHPTIPMGMALFCSHSINTALVTGCLEKPKDDVGQKNVCETPKGCVVFGGSGSYTETGSHRGNDAIFFFTRFQKAKFKSLTATWNRV